MSAGAQAGAALAGATLQTAADLFTTIYSVESQKQENARNRAFAEKQNQLWASLSRELQTKEMAFQHYMKGDFRREQLASTGLSAADQGLILALGASASPSLTQTWTPAGFKTFTPGVQSVNSLWTSSLSSRAHNLGQSLAPAAVGAAQSSKLDRKSVV